MNNSINFNADISDEERRERLFAGELFVYSPMESSIEFCRFARSLIEEHFGNLDPVTAQHFMKVEDYAALLAKLKPTFIHHPRCKQLIENILDEVGADPNKVYCDVPKMRTSTSDGYLTSGIAYAWHPHRDTWYSAPFSQINWWTPIFPMTADNGMAFHPRYFEESVANTSSGYNYYEWNAKYRGAAASKINNVDDRPLPKPVVPIDLEQQIRIVCPVGGLVLFSGQQMHSSVPNTSGVTRFSIDFRTVHKTDLEEARSAPNVDSECTGTALRDFLRATDQEPLEDDVIARYDDGTGSCGDLVFNQGEDTATDAEGG